MTETFKALLVGDQHLSDTTPSSRSDDYLEEIFTLIRFILAYSVSKQIPYVILLGDLFHRKRPSLNSHGLVAMILTELRKYSETYAATHGEKPRIFSLVGNHDILFTIDHVNRQPITVLQQAGVLEILDKPVMLTAGVELNGHPYSEATETDPAAYHLDYLEEDSFKLWCFHSTLLPDGQQFFGTWVNFNQVADIKANVIACGHYHPGYEPSVIQAHGKYWINPGAISRGTAEEHNLSREVKVVGIKVVKEDDGSHSFGFKNIPLPAKPAADIFKVETIRGEQSRKAEVERFVESLNSNVTADADLSSLDQLKGLLYKLSDDPRVIKSASEYLDEAAEDIGD